ncbi:MAG: D-alanine--D-alanine ligase [Actinobacteria bacterium]|nr:D-alanine--D-alanine ligase [Actinomycetota bacterium]
MPKVAVLKGGLSAEREVSLNTGAQVAAGLAAAGFRVAEIDAADRDFIDQILSEAPDVVFICLHGRFGEDGTVQGLLELLGVPYVGSGVLASALAMDKVISKQLLKQANIPTADFLALRRDEPVDVVAISEALGVKTVVKPANEGSAIGITISHEPDELSAAVERAFLFDDRVLVEGFVSGTEVTVGVLGNDEPKALPTLEIVSEHEFFDYESKYVPGLSRHIVPARISSEADAECQRLAIEVHRLFGCKGMSRADMIVTTEGQVFVLETNTIPGMTSTSLYPDAARAAGIEFPQLCANLIELALEGKED